MAATGAASGGGGGGGRSRSASASTPAHVLNARVASRGRNLFCTLLDNRDDQAERKQADDRRSVAKLGRGYRIPKSFIDRFEWGELVGSGAYSYVQRAVDKRTGQHVAIKCVRKDPLDQELCDQIETEVALQSEVCKHDNIVTILEFVNTPSMYFIVMELLEGDLLRTIVEETRAGRYSERQAASTIYGLAAALNACHSANIAHLDIKPDNVLFDGKGTLKLADFGMAAKIPVYRDVGTPLFVAPEILLEGQCDTKADIFSLGVVAYILLCGFAPWVEARTLDDLSEAIKHDRWDFYSPFWDDITEDAKELVRSMMDPDPRRRPTAKEVMQHKWVVTTASTRPINSLVPRRIISHARHEFVKRASRVQMLNRIRRVPGQPRQGTREALAMARTAPLSRGSSGDLSDPGADPTAQWTPQEAGGTPVSVDGNGSAITPASQDSLARTAFPRSSGKGAPALEAVASSTPVIVNRSSGSEPTKKSALRGAAKAAAKRRREEQRSGSVTFADVVMEVTPQNHQHSRNVKFADPSNGAAAAGAGAGGAGAGRMTAGDRAARAARRAEERSRRTAAGSRWERLQAASANLVAARVRELDAAHVEELEEIM